MTVTRSLSRQGASVGSLGYILGGSPLRQTDAKHRKARPKNTLNSPTQLRNTGRDYQVMPNAYHERHHMPVKLEVHLENRSEIQSVGYDRYDVQALGSYGL